MKASRRSLLRASLAAPIVLTVTTAQAQLAASSAVACLRRDNGRFNNPAFTPANLVNTDGDDWLRTELSLVSLDRAVQTGTNSGFEPVTGEFFLGFDNNTFWQLLPSNGGFTGTPTTLTRNNTRVSANIRSVYALVYVNTTTGQVTGIAAQPNGGAGVTASCLVSAAPGTVLPSGGRLTAQSRRTQSSVMWRRSQ